MCGLLFTNDIKINDLNFKNALNNLNHRGPDAIDTYFYQNIKAGHTRLKVIDIDNRSNQPFSSSSGKFKIIFNGEIYNFKELSKKYQLKDLKTNSDTEVLIELYELKGSKIFVELNGMFAAVIFDVNNGDYIAVRDRRGVKPLYIYGSGNNVIISSEIKPIIQLIDDPTLDQNSVLEYKMLRANFNGTTLFKGIRLIEPSTFYDGKNSYKYWNQDNYSEQLPPSDEELDFLIKQAINRRLTSDVPVGAYLSGGLDSSLICAISGVKNTWTVGFSDENEFDWAKILSKKIGSSHHETLIDYDEFIHLWIKMVNERLEPLSVPNEILIYKMTNAVKKLNTVVLSGEGADELFLGYDRIFRWGFNQTSFDVKEFAKMYGYSNSYDYEIIENAVSKYIGKNTPIQIIINFFREAHLHGLLRRLDNSTMRCSVEARVPFVDDNDLMERIIGIDYKYFINNESSKIPLKRIAEKYLPKTIIDRKKVGFPVPLTKILGTSKMSSFGKLGYDTWLDTNISYLENSLKNFKGKFL